MNAPKQPKPKKRKPTRPSDLAKLTATVASVHEKCDAVILAMSSRIAEITEKVDALLLAFHAMPRERDEDDGDPASNGAMRRVRTGLLD